MKIFAIVDGDKYSGLFSMLKQYNPPAVCLVNPPVKDYLVHRSPYIVEINSEPVKNWLAQNKTPWGMYLMPKEPVTLIGLRKHFRKFTYAVVPDRSTPIPFPFYDPRNLWDFMEVMDDHTLHAFMGSIGFISTSYGGKFIQKHFEERRAPFKNPNHRLKSTYITFNEEQYGVLNKIHEQRYIEELSAYMQPFIDPAIIEKIHNTPDKIHQRMLEHERDVKGAAITNPIDQTLLAEHAEENGFYLHQSDKWFRVRGEESLEVENQGLLWALFNNGKSPISEYAFHQATQGKFSHLGINPTPIVDKTPKPFFQRQGNGWIRLAHEEAHFGDVISEEYAEVLERNYQKTQQTKVFEDDFHIRTKGRYQSKPKEDEVDIPETMEGLIKQIDQFAEDFYYFCREQGITDDHSHKKLLAMFVTHNVFKMKGIPDEWLSILRKNGRLGTERAEQLFVIMFNKIGEQNGNP